MIERETVGQLKGLRVMAQTLQGVKPLHRQRKRKRPLFFQLIDSDNNFLMFELPGQLEHLAATDAAIVNVQPGVRAIHQQLR